MKRILLLADAGSEHTEKWALGLASRGLTIGLFSLNPPAYSWFKNNPGIQFLNEFTTIKSTSSTLSKLAYLKFIPQLKQAINDFRPDVVHAHYATSYGLLARWSGFKPYFISAWGTDVMKFPQKNFLARSILKKNLMQAAKVLATSHTILEAIHKVSNVPVTIVPFGVDLTQFKPTPKLQLFPADSIVIAAIKPIETIYGTAVLLAAFQILHTKYPENKLRLLIVGEGSLKATLLKKAKDSELSDKILFTGRIDFSNVAHYFNTADIFVNISEYESFGVSVIEAAACEKPVVVTDVGGLREIVEEGKTGYRIPVNDVNATVSAIEKLILNPELRKTMGINGRKKVEQHYDWKNNLYQMIEIYAQF